MAQFGKDEFFHGKPHRMFRTGRRYNNATAVDASGGATHDRRRPNLLIGEIAEEFSESNQALLQQSLHRFEGRIPSRDSGSTIDDNRLDPLIPYHPLDGVANLPGIVLDKMVTDHLMTVPSKEVYREGAARVRVGSARITTGNDDASDMGRGLMFVLPMGRCRMRIVILLSHIMPRPSPGSIEPRAGLCRYVHPELPPRRPP